MAARKVKTPGGGEEIPDALGVSFARIANLLALLLTKGEDETSKVTTLSAAGFSGAEIAAILNKQPNTVSVILYKARKKPRSKRCRAKRK